VKVFFRDEIFITIHSVSPFYLFIWGSESFSLEIKFFITNYCFSLFIFFSGGVKVLSQTIRFTLFTFLSGEVKVLSQSIFTFLSGGK